MQVSATRHSSRISMELTASLASFGTRSDGFAVATCTGGKSAGTCDGSGNAATTIDSGSSEAAGLPVAIPVTDSTEMELTASLASFGTRSDGFAVATCTGGKSADGTCDGSGNAASTIDSGSSEAAGLPVAILVTDSTAVATSALAITGLPIAIACGSSASLALAARDAARFSIGTAWVFSMPAEPKPASQATIHPARTTVPQNAGATVANRRGFIIPSPPMLNSQAAHRADVSDRI